MGGLPVSAGEADQDLRRDIRCLRFALCKRESRRPFRKGGRSGGRSHFGKQGRNEFKIAQTNPDCIRKHMRVFTAGLK